MAQCCRRCSTGRVRRTRTRRCPCGPPPRPRRPRRRRAGHLLGARAPARSRRHGDPRPRARRRRGRGHPGRGARHGDRRHHRAAGSSPTRGGASRRSSRGGTSGSASPTSARSTCTSAAGSEVCSAAESVGIGVELGRVDQRRRRDAAPHGRAAAAPPGCWPSPPCPTRDRGRRGRADPARARASCRCRCCCTARRAAPGRCWSTRCALNMDTRIGFEDVLQRARRLARHRQRRPRPLRAGDPRLRTSATDFAFATKSGAEACAQAWQSVGPLNTVRCMARWRADREPGGGAGARRRAPAHHTAAARRLARHAEPAVVDPRAARPGRRPCAGRPRDTSTLLLRPARAGRGTGRASTSASAPARRGVALAHLLGDVPARTTRRLAITVKRVPGGLVSGALAHGTPVGMLLRLAPPAGEFVLPDPVPEKLLFVTAGSGITPGHGDAAPPGAARPEALARRGRTCTATAPRTTSSSAPSCARWPPRPGCALLERHTARRRPAHPGRAGRRRARLGRPARPGRAGRPACWTT